MAEFKATNMLISILLVTLVVGVLVSVMARSTDEYGVSYDNSTFAVYQNLEEVNDISQEIQNKTEDIGTRTGAVDILGGFFSDAYQSLKLTKESFNTVGAMVDTSTESLNLGENTGLYKAVLSGIILIIIVLGIILAAIIKRNL